jgi:hypothetical protein
MGARKRAPLAVIEIALFRDFAMAPPRRNLTFMNERPKSAEKLQRQRRLGAALRENLKRRRTQAKGRVAAHGIGRPGKSHDSAGIAADKPKG